MYRQTTPNRVSNRYKQQPQTTSKNGRDKILNRCASGIAATHGALQPCALCVAPARHDT